MTFPEIACHSQAGRWTWQQNCGHPLPHLLASPASLACFESGPNLSQIAPSVGIRSQLDFQSWVNPTAKRVASPGYLEPGACTWWAPRVSHRSMPAATLDGDPAGIAYPNITIQRTGRRAAFFHDVIPSCLTDRSSRFKFGRFSVIALTGSRRVALRTIWLERTV